MVTTGGETMTDPLEADVTKIRIDVGAIKEHLRGINGKVGTHDTFLLNSCPKKHDELQKALAETKIELARSMTSQNIIQTIILAVVIAAVTYFIR
jgi:hypothetical protein